MTPSQRTPHRPLALLAALVVAFGSASLGQQSSTAFTGHWVLTSATPARANYDQFWLGTEATITQDGSTLVITRLNPPPQREARFTLNAPESRNEYLEDGRRIAKASRATLSRGMLLISTDTAEPDGKRWLSNINRWSLEEDGTLVVGDTEICGRGECPSVITTLRFKKKS